CVLYFSFFFFFKQKTAYEILEFRRVLFRSSWKGCARFPVAVHPLGAEPGHQSQPERSHRRAHARRRHLFSMSLRHVTCFPSVQRSEERRVGKELRSRGSTYHKKKK